jgi:hypothetical protein
LAGVGEAFALLTAVVADLFVKVLPNPVVEVDEGVLDCGAPKIDDPVEDFTALFSAEEAIGLLSNDLNGGGVDAF